MTETLTRTEGPGDAELISVVRGGDLSAYGDLFARHVDAARRLARQLVSHADADDLVSDAFAKVLRVIQGGGGPDVAFRAYLLTAVRRLHVDRMRAGAKLQPSDDMEPFAPGVPFRDTAVEGFENAAAARAFASLPERWQLVLWHTEVEGQKPADIAPLLGMSPNSVSALAYRAREGLRQAFLNSHAAELEDAECRWTHDHLGAYIRGGASRRDATKVEQHLDECRPCMGIYLELVEVNSNLGALIAPLLLGGAGAGYLAASGAATKGGVLVLVADRVRELVVGNTQAAAVSGVVTATAVVGITVATILGGDDGRTLSEDPRGPAPTIAPEAPGDDSGTDSPGDSRPELDRDTAQDRARADDAAAGPGADTAGNEPAATDGDAGPVTTVADGTPGGDAPAAPAAVAPAAPAAAPPPAPSGGSGGGAAPGPGGGDAPAGTPGTGGSGGTGGTGGTGEPTQPPPPTHVLELVVTVDETGATVRFDVSGTGFVDGGTAELVVDPSTLTVPAGRTPDGCTYDGSTFVCPLSAGQERQFHFVAVEEVSGVTMELTATSHRSRYADASDSYAWPG